MGVAHLWEVGNMIYTSQTVHWDQENASVSQCDEQKQSWWYIKYRSDDKWQNPEFLKSDLLQTDLTGGLACYS